MKIRSHAAAILAGAFAILLSGCADEPEARRPAQPSAAPSAPTSGAGIALDPRYEATLSEGIDFTKPGFPAFVKEVHGLSIAEPWGRWTDANLAPAARIRFRQPLPQKFTLELRATGLGPNAFQPVRIRAGAVERTLTLGNPAQPSYRVAFENTGGADTIEIVPPAPILAREVNPQNPDTRRLGVGLTSLRILD